MCEISKISYFIVDNDALFRDLDIFILFTIAQRFIEITMVEEAGDIRVIDGDHGSSSVVCLIMRTIYAEKG